VLAARGVAATDMATLVLEYYLPQTEARPLRIATVRRPST
jgi:hypothetical protein